MSRTTVEHLADPEAANRGQSWFFCATADCQVVYFAGELELLRDTLRVPVFQKGSAPSRLVCYCFGHSVADVLEAARADGSNAVVDSITQRCRQGLDQCEETNPQGRCCLGNVRSLAGPEAPDCLSCGDEREPD